MRSLIAQFIKNELDAYISDQRAYADPVVVSLIVKAFEAYDEYKRLVSLPIDTQEGFAYGRYTGNGQNL